MSEQTELRALADRCEEALAAGRRQRLWSEDLAILRRAADKLDRLTALVAHLESEGDV